MKKIAVLTLFCLLPLAAAGHEYRSGRIVVDHPWARATSGPTGAVFLEIRNEGTAPDRLIAAEAPDIAERVELHVHEHDGDVMRMREVNAIDIAAGATAALMPGHAHVMLVALTRRLAEGDQFALFLIFEQAGLIEVEVQVEAAGATSSSD